MLRFTSLVFVSVAVLLGACSKPDEPQTDGCPKGTSLKHSTPLKPFWPPSQPPPTEINQRWPGIERGQWCMTTNLERRGPAILRYSDGSKLAEGEYLNDLEHGPWTIWHENGKRKREGQFRKGQEHGKWTRWHDNGRKDAEIQYVDGKRQGLVVEWDEKGVKRSHIEFHNDLPHGKIKEWSEDGTLIEEGEMRANKRCGRRTWGHQFPDGPIEEQYPPCSPL